MTRRAAWAWTEEVPVDLQRPLRIVLGGPLVGDDTVLCHEVPGLVTFVMGLGVWAQCLRSPAWRLKTPEGVEVCVGCPWGATIEPWSPKDEQLLREAAVGLGRQSVLRPRWGRGAPRSAAR